jgi:Mg2+/Co2+ transporter CorB
LDEISLGALFGALAVLIILSGFFSGSETAMMALNRYRLRHLAERKHRGARRASELLERPDRLIGLILLGNNFVNIFASSLATLIALRTIGQAGIALAAGLLTLVILIFAEVMPKTLAALHPERIAFPASVILKPLLWLMYPFVFVVNAIANGVLKLLRIRPEDSDLMTLSREELRTVVKEAGAIIPRRHQSMLFGILDLEKATIEDIMVPRNEIVGIDLDSDPGELEEQLTRLRHTRLPVYRGNIDNLVGILHSRRATRLFEDDTFDKQALEAELDEPYFVPSHTPLHTQLFNFQRQKQRIGVIVDEYGQIQGLVTLEDILEEIVGEFTTDPQDFNRDIFPQEDGSYLIDGSATIRDINRMLRWKLPTRGPKTLNGLVLEQLESIPEAGVSLRIGNYTIEILQATGQSLKTARVRTSSSL